MVEQQLSIRPMQEVDIQFGLQLGEMSGWNQVAADWLRIFHYQFDGCFVGEISGKPIGTITTTCYGSDLAWIGMMLVHPDYRRRGYATALMSHAIRWLKKQRVQCIKLDATPAGAKVYEKLGFQPEWEFHRWMRAGDETLSPNPLGNVFDSFSILQTDQQAFGIDRHDWLSRLAIGSRTEFIKDSFGMIRTGRLADYLGPVISHDNAVAESLIGSLVNNTKRSIFWDVPGPNLAAQQLATQFGFNQVRPLLRMWLGEKQIKGSPQMQYALASPATG